MNGRTSYEMAEAQSILHSHSLTFAMRVYIPLGPSRNQETKQPIQPYHQVTFWRLSQNTSSLITSWRRKHLRIKTLDWNAVLIKCSRPMSLFPLTSLWRSVRSYFLSVRDRGPSSPQRAVLAPPHFNQNQSLPNSSSASRKSQTDERKLTRSKLPGILPYQKLVKDIEDKSEFRKTQALLATPTLKSD